MTSPRSPNRPNINMLSSPLGGLRRHQVLQPGHVPQRHAGQHLRDDGPERRQRIVRIAARVQQHKTARLLAALRHRQVDLRVRTDFEARLTGVGDDTHDAPLSSRDDHDAPEWIFTTEEHERRRVAEDDNGFGPVTIIVREIPAAPERDRQRPVITRGDDLRAHRHVDVERLARRLQRVDPQVDAERNAGRRRGRVDDAGQLARAGRRCRPGPAACPSAAPPGFGG